MKRRSFLKTSSLVSLPFALGGFQVSAIAKSGIFNKLSAGDGDDRVLVLVQLNGGNDGLNTLIPLDQYENLVGLRSNIIIPENKLLKLTDENALHSDMTGMHQLFQEGKLNVVQNVGYPNQNRSHFRSTDIWHSGSSADEYVDTGWFGRYLDTQYANYPEDYPNDIDTDPFALTLGYVVSETCQGLNSNFSIAITDPNNLKNLGEYEGELYNGTCYGEELNFVRDEIKKTNEYAEVVVAASTLGENKSSKYNEDSSLSQQLKIVARLIAGGLKTKVYVVSLGGFDTHSLQVDINDPKLGVHADLLKNLSDSIDAFQDDITLLGVDKRVVGMTYSEFGRQIKSNASFGTDHGTSAPLFVFGSCVNPVIIGENIEIPQEVPNQSGMPMQYDYRSVYGSILMDWFEVTESDVKSLLFEDFQYLNILNPCEETAAIDIEHDIALEIFPNPSERTLNITFDNTDHVSKISIFNILGYEVLVHSNNNYPPGVQTIHQNIVDLPSGQYILRIIGKKRSTTKAFVKI